MQPPDFIQIPREALVDSTLRPGDCILLGYIYWFTRLKNEKCTAGNAVLASLTGLKENTVQGGLERLEGGRYIERVFKDKARRQRTEIICNVQFGKQVPTKIHTVPTKIHTSRQIEVPTKIHQNKNKKEKVKRSDFNENSKTQKPDHRGQPSPTAAKMREARQKGLKPWEVLASDDIVRHGAEKASKVETHNEPTLPRKANERRVKALTRLSFAGLD